MRLASLLNEELIEVTDSITTRSEALQLLAKKIHENYEHSTDQDAIERAVLEREELGSTLFENGIAIPHARLTNFEDLIIGVMIFQKPIEEDGQLLKMLFLVLTSKTSSTLYLNTLSGIAQISENKELYNKLYAANSGSDFIDILLESDIRIKKGLTISDIMERKLVSITPDMTLKRLMDLLAHHNLSYAPVVDEENHFTGEVNINDIIELGIPNYATMIGNLSFLSSFEPFEDLLRKEDTILVKDIMKKPTLVVTPDTSIVEMAFKLSSSHKRHAAVVKEGKLIGVISLVDIINKVLRV